MDRFTGIRRSILNQLFFLIYLVALVESSAFAAVSGSTPIAPVNATNVKVVRPHLKSSECPEPVYPLESKRFGQEGKVKLNVYVNKFGVVEDAQVFQSSSFPLLDEAAIEFIKRCKFAPATQDGEPVAAWTQLMHNWKLEDVDPLGAPLNQQVPEPENPHRFSFREPYKPEKPEEFLKKMCSGFVADMKSSAEPASGSAPLFISELTDDKICSCLEKKLKKNKYLKPLFSDRFEKYIEKMDMKNFGEYVSAQSVSSLLSCAAESIDDSIKNVDPRKH